MFPGHYAAKGLLFLFHVILFCCLFLSSEGLSTPVTPPFLAAGDVEGATSLEVRGNGAVIGPSLMRRQGPTRAGSLSRHTLARRSSDLPTAPLRIPARRLRQPSISPWEGGDGTFSTSSLQSHKPAAWEEGSWAKKAIGSRGRSPAYRASHRAFIQGRAGLSEAARAAVASSRKRRGQRCDPMEETCCDPEDEPEAFEACKEKQKEQHAEFADKILPCDDQCKYNCCCFFVSAVKFIIRAGEKVKLVVESWCVQAFITLQALSYHVLDVAPEPKKPDPEDPEEAVRYTRDVLKDVMKWWFGSMIICYLIVRIHETIMWVRIMLLKTAARQKARANPEAYDPGEDPTSEIAAKQYLTENELARLGGIVRSLVVKMRSMSRNKWHLAVFFSLGLFYWTMRTPNQVCVMILGKSGRMLILNKEPLTPMGKLYSVYVTCGFTFLAIFSCIVVWLRSIERGLIMAMKSPDPEVRAAAKESGGTAAMLLGKVHVFALAIWLLMWFINLLLYWATLRPWAGLEKRDYYESNEANCAQYFRGGSRGAIPCLMRRRRYGGMKFCYGPYPEPEIWDNIGQGMQGKYLDSLRPLQWLPEDHDDGGVPPSGGGGQPQTPAQQIGYAQWLLGIANWILGTLGLFCFGIHMMNLTQNFELCPNTVTINKCVREHDCTRYISTGWFQLFMERSGYMSGDAVREMALEGNIQLAHIAEWLKLTTMQEAVEAVIMIASKACMIRRDELIDGPIQQITPQSADTLGTFNAGNYVALRNAFGVDISWDNVGLECKQCTMATTLHYFSNFENSAELLEVFLLCVTCYVSAMLIAMMNTKVSMAPIANLKFESDPSNAQDLDVMKIERESLQLMSQVFFYRYNTASRHSGGVAPQVQRLEEKIRYAMSNGMDTRLFPDPWMYDNSATSWSEYALVDVTNARLFLVNRKLLGILEGEEVVSAWSETPRLTVWQHLILWGGFLFFLVTPIVWGIAIKKWQCIVEGIVAGGTHMLLFYYFVLLRRIQAGFVLTTRRIFQLTRSPAYYDICGKVEPILKIDVLVHNSALVYVSGLFRAKVPILHQILAKIFNCAIYRPGTVTCWGSEGVMQMWRSKGDTREIIESFSKVSYAEVVGALSKEMGEGFMKMEKQKPENQPRDPCWPLSLCCCPSTPLPPYASEKDIIKRYCFKYDNEENIYGRMSSVRPANCGDLCCGSGYTNVSPLTMLASYAVGAISSGTVAQWMWSKDMITGAQAAQIVSTASSLVACTAFLAQCAMLDECVNELMVTTHRTLIEQRVSQRYCRIFFCMRPDSNIRVTFLSNFRFSSYNLEKSGEAVCCCALQQDMQIKLLPRDARAFPQGLILRQQPYRFVYKDQEPSDHDWINHLSKIYDVISSEPTSKELLQSSSEDDDDYDYDGGGGGGGPRRLRLRRGKGTGKGALPKSQARPQEPPPQQAMPKGKARPKGKAKARRGRPRVVGEHSELLGAEEEEEEEEEEDETEVVREGGIFNAIRNVVNDVAVGLETVTGGGTSTSGDQPRTSTSQSGSADESRASAAQPPSEDQPNSTS